MPSHVFGLRNTCNRQRKKTEIVSVATPVIAFQISPKIFCATNFSQTSLPPQHTSTTTSSSIPEFIPSGCDLRITVQQ